MNRGHTPEEPTMSHPLRTLTTTVSLLIALILLGPPSSAYAAPRDTQVDWPPGTIQVAGGLTLPWGLVQLGDGSLLFTSSDSGEIRQVTGVGQVRTVGTVPDIDPTGEGGLLGLVQDPSNPGILYAYASTAGENRVLRLGWDGSTVTVDRPIVTGIPHGGRHNGGRVAFGPDDQLYVTTGEAGRPELAQDRRSLGGKILRVDRNGQAAAGNPFTGRPDTDARIWSWGHRNVEGLDWDARGRLWSSELGENTWDELNLIEPGRNYGWPVCEGPNLANTSTACTDSRYTRPVNWWSTAEMSPSGVEVDGDKGYIAALRGQSLWQTWVNGGTPRRLLQGSYGRLRTPLRAADGRLFLMTSNGGGTDRIMLVDPAGWRTAIETKYRATGGADGRLGAPRTGEWCDLVDGGCYSHYAGGSIYWSRATGAHTVWGAIRDRWAGLGWERGQLGYPTSDEFCGLRDGGCAQRFTGGLLYWTPQTGAQPVWGAIGQAYADQRWETGRLGYPIGPERCGLRDGGCFQEFQGGAIYWSPGTGAWVVLGAIRDYWASTGWERGPWGYPTGNEACQPGRCAQSFQGGVVEIRW
ncbi:hypothetical protein CGZ98_08225 [Enemella evansiae]|nr:hypothetical protein CGZ98_08225 [Enemella evansiae]